MLIKFVVLFAVFAIVSLGHEITTQTVHAGIDEQNIDFVLDKISYAARDTIQITGTVNIEVESEFVIEIINPSDQVIKTETVNVEQFTEDGFFIPTFGQEWEQAGFYQLKLIYGDEEQTRFFGFGDFDPAEFEPQIKFDKEKYSWTDTVEITVISPISNQSNEQLDEIKIKISSDVRTLSSYTLEETGFSHGVFSGKITLSGNYNLDIDGDGRKGDTLGITGGQGPEGGSLSTNLNDRIKVSFSPPFSDETFEKTASIQSQLAQLEWEKKVMEFPERGLLRVIDRDMNTHSTKRDKVEVLVWSTISEFSKKYNLLETETGNGIFEGKVRFVLEESDKGVLIKPGGKIFFKYEDRTLPSGYTTNRLEITSNATVVDLIDPQKIPENEKESTGPTEIPNWVKNNARWWSQDEISDSNFVLGIQFLIEERIIQIPQTQSNSEDSRQNIPSWIKNNAGWWSQGLISDDDFVQGLQFLVEKRILRV